MRKYQSMVRIHFDGDIAENHQLPMRVLGKGVTHIQTAIDRAYLDLKYKDGVWKHARLAHDDYPKTEFIVQAPKEGGYILDFFSRLAESKRYVDRVSDAINQAVVHGTETIIILKDQVENRKQQIKKQLLKPISFKTFFNNPGQEVVRRYGDRSIAKEIDQVLSTIRPEYAGDSTFELALTGESTKTYTFNRLTSQSFHEAVSRRSLGVPVVYSGTMKQLDIDNKRGKFRNNDTGRTSMLHFASEKDFLKAHPYLTPDNPIQFIGCPLIEFGALEPNSGDVYFVDIIDNKTLQIV